MCLDSRAIDRLRDLGGETLISKMIDAYLGSSPERIQGAVEGMRTGDLAEVEHVAHSLKSSSANFGADRLVDLASRVERLAAARGDSSKLSELVEEMVEAFEQVRNKLESMSRELQA